MSAKEKEEIQDLKLSNLELRIQILERNLEELSAQLKEVGKKARYAYDHSITLDPR